MIKIQLRKGGINVVVDSREEALALTEQGWQIIRMLVR